MIQEPSHKWVNILKSFRVRKRSWMMEAIDSAFCVLRLLPPAVSLSDPVCGWSLVCFPPCFSSALKNRTKKRQKVGEEPHCVAYFLTARSTKIANGQDPRGPELPLSWELGASLSRESNNRPQSPPSWLIVYLICSTNESICVIYSYYKPLSRFIVIGKSYYHALLFTTAPLNNNPIIIFPLFLFC